MTSQLSREWLQKTISDIETMRDEMPFGLDEDGNNTLAAFKLALAGMDSEPVAISLTVEHRRVIEMLLSVCGAAFELSDDACEAEIDGEVCLTVPPDAFHKLSDVLDEIEETLPTEDPDRPDVFLAWSAMPRAALKSLLYAAPPALVAVPDDVLKRLEHEANHVTDWHHMDEHSCKVNRRDLLTLLNACRSAMLKGEKP